MCVRVFRVSCFVCRVRGVFSRIKTRSLCATDFEQTDGIIWVVDSADVDRLEMCRAELERLLLEEVRATQRSLPSGL